MPHSSRRPRKPYHPKRIISESEDGWSRVEHTAPPRYGRTAVVDSSLPPVDKSLTVQKLLDEHSRCKQQWVQSEARRWLQQLLARQMAEGGWEFLQSLSVAVLDPPQAEELVDQSTLIFIPCIEWLLELPFMLVAKTSPLYVSSSMHWIIDEAERSRNRLTADVQNDSSVLKDCDDAIAAAKAVLDTHDENKMPEADFADGHSLALTIYTLKHQDED
ncbi:unnamed protein product, partial [Aureobasidium vineae]